MNNIIQELNKRKLFIEENINDEINNNEIRIQEHVFFDFFKSTKFNNENSIDKLLLLDLFHKGNLALNQYQKMDLEFGDYYLDKFFNTKKKLTKEYPNLNSFEFPLIAYKLYKTKEYEKAINLLENSIISLENLFDIENKSCLFGKIEQKINIIKIHISNNDFELVKEKIEILLNSISKDIYYENNFFRNDEVTFYLNQSEFTKLKTKDDFFSNLFFKVLNNDNSQILEWFLKLFSIEYNININNLQYNESKKYYVICEYEFSKYNFPKPIEIYFLNNFLLENPTFEKSIVVNNYISFLNED